MLMLPVGASAQETQQPSDPEADSPSGVVYELPLDRARRDSAPRRGERNGRRRGGADRDGGRGDGGAGGQTDGGSGGGGPAPGREPTSIRSENNFGSSSEVPGLDDDADLAAGGSDGGDGGSGFRRQDGASTGAGGAGIPSTGGQTGAGGSPLHDPTTASSGGPSDATIVSLLGLILIVGGGLGVMAARARRRSS